MKFIVVNSAVSAPDYNFVYQNCRLWTGISCLFDKKRKKNYLFAKMHSDDEVEMFDEGMTDFLYAKNAKYKWSKLDIAKTERSCWHDYKIDLEVDNVFKLMEKEFDISKNVCLCNNLNYHYHFSGGAGPLLIKLEYLEATIMKGRHLPKHTYLESNSIGITQALWKVNTELTSKICERTNKNPQLLDNILIRINAGRLPIDKITYFKDLVICYDRVEEVKYRGKEKYCINARVISRQVLLPDEYQYMSESE